MIIFKMLNTYKYEVQYDDYTPRRKNITDKSIDHSRPLLVVMKFVM